MPVKTLSVQEVNQSRKTNLAPALIVLATFLFCYIQAITELVSFWKQSYVYSYGFLIPAISLYLVWLNKKKLKGIHLIPDYLFGLPFMLCGLLLFILGNRSGVLVIESLSIIVTISGMVLLIFGKRYFLALLFPITYLLFMIPIWDSLMVRLQFPFQNFTAFTAAHLLQLSGVPVYRNAIFLELPNITLEVANVCSGINNLIAVLAIALPLAYVSLKSWPRRIVLVIGGIVIAALSNGLRVAMIGFLSYNGISVTLHGPGHILQAMFVSFVGFIVLFIGSWILSDRHSESAISLEPEPISQGNNDSHPCNTINQRICFLAAGILFIAGMYINFVNPSPVPLRSDLKLFPYEIGAYRGSDVSVDHNISEMIHPDVEKERIYKTASGREVNLYIGYLESQKQGKELVNYKSAGFHNGASCENITINANRTVKINKVLSQKDGTSKVIYFWYDLSGTIVADRYYAKMQTAFDAVFKQRSNGAFIMISSTVDKSKDDPRVFEDAEDFIRVLIPVLHGYLP